MYCGLQCDYSSLQSELDRMTAEETTLRQESAGLERNLTVAKHDLKEVQRKLDAETELRRKAEARSHDFEEQLQTEVSSRISIERSSQQHVEKIQQLDKQVRKSCLLCP